MQQYKHIQLGYVGPVIFVSLALVFGAMLAAAGPSWAQVTGFAAFFILVAAMLVNFSRLTVTVTEEEVMVAFGQGWPRKIFPVSDIRAAAATRNRWLDGFGIRSTDTGLLYNVWGFDSVLLNLDGGEAFRIGTDEPEALIAALESVGIATPGTAWDSPQGP